MGKAAAAGAEKSWPECVKSSNPFHECSDYCLCKIAEAKQRLDDDLASLAPPEEHTVHPDCINATNPYHVFSEYCFKRIADTKLGSEHREQEEPPAADAAGSFGKSDVVPEQGDGDDSAAPQEDADADDGYPQRRERGWVRDGEEEDELRD